MNMILIVLNRIRLLMIAILNKSSIRLIRSNKLINNSRIINNLDRNDLNTGDKISSQAKDLTNARTQRTMLLNNILMNLLSHNISINNQSNSHDNRLNILSIEDNSIRRIPPRATRLV